MLTNHAEKSFASNLITGEKEKSVFKVARRNSNEEERASGTKKKKEVPAETPSCPVDFPLKNAGTRTKKKEGGATKPKSHLPRQGENGRTLIFVSKRGCPSMSTGAAKTRGEIGIGEKTTGGRGEGGGSLRRAVDREDSQCACSPLTIREKRREWPLGLVSEGKKRKRFFRGSKRWAQRKIVN